MLEKLLRQARRCEDTKEIQRIKTLMNIKTRNMETITIKNKKGNILSALKYYELDDLVKMIDQYNSDIVESAYNCGIQFSDIEECYQGQYNYDAEFVEELLEGCGDIPNNIPSYVYIDWERTARDVMMDYTEDNGYYFRSI